MLRINYICRDNTLHICDRLKIYEKKTIYITLCGYDSCFLRKRKGLW